MSAFSSTGGEQQLARCDRNTIHKMGLMSKLGGQRDGKSGNWKTRFFVLSDDL
jgi:hypothetical protein